MTGQLGFALLAFTSLLAMADPLGLVPVYLSATTGYSPARRSRTIRVAILTAFLVLMMFGLLGIWIFRFFGVTPHAFRIAGGIVLFKIGYDMLQAKRSRARTTEEEEEASHEKEDIGIVPLGLPLIAGPGTISAVVALTTQARTSVDQAIVYAVILLVLLITWAVLTMADEIALRLGPNGMNVIERIIALIVMVIGVQFVIDGAEGAILDFLTRARG